MRKHYARTALFLLLASSGAVAGISQSLPVKINGIEDITESTDYGFLLHTTLAAPLNAGCANSATNWFRVTATTKTDVDRLFALALAALGSDRNVRIFVSSDTCTNGYQQLISIRME